MTNDDYILLDSKFIVKTKSYDAGHGTSPPDDYDIRNNRLTCCTTNNLSQAQWICDRLNELRVYKLEELIQDAKTN